VATSNQSAESVAEQVAGRKCQKYAELFAAYDFQPVVVESKRTRPTSRFAFSLIPARKFPNVLATVFYSSGSVC